MQHLVKLGQVVIDKVRPLYADDNSVLRFNLGNTVCPFDSSANGLCLKLCPWTKLRRTKAGVKMHTPLDLRGNNPVFLYLTDAFINDVKVLYNYVLRWEQSNRLEYLHSF